MSTTQNGDSKDVVLATTAHAVEIQSIQIKFKNVRHRLLPPISVRIMEDKNEIGCSSRYQVTGSIIDWHCKRRFESRTQFTISIQEHNKWPQNVTKLVDIPVEVGDLFMKPVVVINEPNGIKLSVTIQCNVAGPLVDYIRLIVQASQDKLKSMKEFMDKFAKVCEALNIIVKVATPPAQIQPFAKVAVASVGTFYEACKKRRECHKAVLDLMADIASFLPFTNMPPEGMKSDMVVQTVKEMLTLFESISIKIIEYSSDYDLGSLLTDRLDEVNALKEEFRKLKEILDWHIKTETWHSVSRIEQNTEALLLARLDPVMDAYYKSNKTCFEGSAKNTLKIIDDWSVSGSKILWMYGSEGSGKTAVAHTFAQSLYAHNRLAGCFFCDKNDADRRDPEKIMPTIAYQLTKWHDAYRRFIIGLLKGQGELKLRTGLSDQFKLLVQQPLARMSADLPPTHKPLIFVLDALDECCTSASARGHLAAFIRAIASEVPWLKVFVTSKKCPELEVNFPQDDFQHFDISDPSLDLADNIAVYANHCTGKNTSLPSESGTSELASRLFSRICTALHLSHLKRDTESAHVSASTYITMGQSKLDDLLYILFHHTRGRNGYDTNLVSIVKDVLAAITCININMPLSTSTHFLFLQTLHPEVTWEDFTGFLSSFPLLFYKAPDGSLHTILSPLPFLEFLSDAKRSGQFGVDIRYIQKTLAQLCLDTMHSQLKFNICGLESSHVENRAVPDLQSRIRTNVSDILHYSCLHWMDHVSLAGDNPIFCSSVTNILCSVKALYWIEVLSLVKALERGVDILSKCTDHFQGEEDIIFSATEVCRTIREFRTAMETSTPHIYVSALSWLPSPSSMANQWHCSFSGQLLASSQNPTSLDSQSPIHALVSDTLAKRIISRLGNDFLQTWDLLDAKNGSPLKGDSGIVLAVAYSPDGSKIVSGSADKTLQIWDASTGLSVGKPLRGHSGSVRAVAFSPDGSRIVSGSVDKTLRVWDASTGLPVGEPFKGHYLGVEAVAYSQDGSRIVSGSFDLTLQIWDAFTGLPVSAPFRGNYGRVEAVAYSPDGSRIVSGSTDRTLRIWDASTGISVGDPLRGHSNVVRAVAYSPDGSRIVSASYDRTLRVWDASTGLPVGEPLTGHSAGVCAVAYSPDGSRIASGSYDKTLRIWDTSTGLSVGGPLRGHSNVVRAVAYSPDGNRIVSGSDDETLRLWDAHTGAQINHIESRWDCNNKLFVSMPMWCTGVELMTQSDNPLRVREDGWIQTLDGGLLLWVPPKHRLALCNTTDCRLKVEWKKLFHGDDWTKIMGDR